MTPNHDLFRNLFAIANETLATYDYLPIHPPAILSLSLARTAQHLHSITTILER